MIASRRTRMWSAVALVCGLAGVAGCSAASTSGGEPTEGAAQAMAQEKPLAAGDPAGPARARRGPGPGPDFLLVAALHELELTAAQRSAIEAALAKNAPGPRDHGPPAPFAALAEGVRAGAIDEAAVMAKLGTAEGGMREHVAAAAAALETLHATLTHEQRRALVDAMTKRMAEHGPPGHPPDGAGPPREGPRGPDGAHGRGGPLGHLLQGLELTDAQRASIERALLANRPAAPDHEAMKKGFEAMHAEMLSRLEAFVSDTFDAKAFAAPPPGALTGGPKDHLARMVKALSVVTPMLTPTQREKLASQLEKGPMGPPGAPPPE